MKFNVDDKPSPSANPRRGYHAKICTVTFEADCEFDKWQEAYQQRVVASLAALFTGDMWCYPAKLIAPNKWEIHHGYDSGD